MALSEPDTRQELTLVNTFGYLVKSRRDFRDVACG
jgi:hypothetical protein